MTKLWCRAAEGRSRQAAAAHADPGSPGAPGAELAQARVDLAEVREVLPSPCFLRRLGRERAMWRWLLQVFLQGRALHGPPATPQACRRTCGASLPRGPQGRYPRPKRNRSVLSAGHAGPTAVARAVVLVWGWTPALPDAPQKPLPHPHIHALHQENERLMDLLTRLDHERGALEREHAALLAACAGGPEAGAEAAPGAGAGAERLARELERERQQRQRAERDFEARAAPQA